MARKAEARRIVREPTRDARHRGDVGPATQRLDEQHFEQAFQDQFPSRSGMACLVADQLKQQREPRLAVGYDHRGQQGDEQSGIGRGEAAKADLHPDRVPLQGRL